MKRKNATRSALFTSIISLLLCVSMLVGTTFAWFTDTVISGNNVIASGNLDVELYHKDKGGAGYVDTQTTLFDDVKLWEPGAVVYENLTVENKGSLALKYQLALNFDKENATKNAEGKTLAEVLKVAVIPGGFNGDREAAKALDYNYDLESFALTGSLLAGTTASEVYGIVIYWQPQPGVEDNKYNVAGGMSIDLGVELFATQLTAETDSFDDTYDVDAWEDTKDQRVEVVSTAANVNTDGSASLEVNAAPSATTNQTVIDAPAGTFDPTDKVEVEVETTNSLFNVTADGGVVASLDVTMTVNGTETSADLEDGKYFTVTTYISKGLTNVGVAYTGTDGKAQPINVEYDDATGKLTFETNHFSNYAVTGEALAYDAANDTALTDVEQVVNATQKESNTVVIPEANQSVIQEEIKNSTTMTEEDKKAAVAATAAAKIGDKTYATLAEAFTEAKAGDTITLLNNVVVDADTTINVAKTVTLDLNGKTVAGTNTGTATHNDLFLVKGNLTVKNGTVTQIHKAANMGWNGCTNTFDVTAGGVLNLIDVVVENKGGTDMNFAVHMNNWGEVTLNVTNSVLKATYMPVRVFNSGPDMNNVTIENSTLEGGNHAFWVHNYCSTDFGGKLYSGSSAAYDETQVAARLNFDIFGNGNTFKSGKDYPVRYGFNTSTYFAADGKPIVIATTLSEVMAAAQKGNVIIDAQGANLGDFYYDGTFGNGTVLKNAKFTYVYGASVNGVATFENCEFVSDHSYSANFSDGSYTGEVIFNNCLFDGWSSFGDTITDIEMNNCTFRKTYNYGILRFYQNAVLTNCTFADSFEGVDTNKNGTNVYLNNCDGIDGKIFNNGSNKGNWIVDGTDISANVESW